LLASSFLLFGSGGRGRVRLPSADSSVFFPIHGNWHYVLGKQSINEKGKDKCLSIVKSTITWDFGNWNFFLFSIYFSLYLSIAKEERLRKVFFPITYSITNLQNE